MTRPALAAAHDTLARLYEQAGQQAKSQTLRADMFRRAWQHTERAKQIRSER